MDLNYFSPYIRVAMDSIIEPPWHLKERVIFDHELLYVKEGKILVTVEEKEYIGIPEDIFLFKPKQRHSIRIIGETRLRQPHIHFDLFYQPDSPDVKVSFKPIEQISPNEMSWFREDFSEYAGLELPNKISLRKTEYFEEMLFNIVKEFQLKLPLYEVNIKGLFSSLWTYLIRENIWDSNPDINNISSELFEIRDYLKIHVHQEISLDSLAKEFRISKFHLARVFKKAFAMTPIHYHRVMRVEKAKELIQFTDTTLTKISESMGFSSINAFSRTFKMVEGVPPTFYRRKGL